MEFYIICDDADIICGVETDIKNILEMEKKNTFKMILLILIAKSETKVWNERLMKNENFFVCEMETLNVNWLVRECLFAHFSYLVK